MKKLFKIAFPSFALMFSFQLFYSCKTNEIPEPQELSFCDTVTANYTANVKAIIDAKCSVANCHLNAQSPNLNDYTQVFGSKDRIGIRALDQQTMPPMGMPALTAEEVAILNCWRAAGFPQN